MAADSRYGREDEVVCPEFGGCQPFRKRSVFVDHAAGSITSGSAHSLQPVNQARVDRLMREVSVVEQSGTH